jgi:hypothetical protein
VKDSKPFNLVFDLMVSDTLLEDISWSDPAAIRFYLEQRVA